MLMHKNKSVNAHDFSMVPRVDIPRSTIERQTRHLTTFDAGFLVPFFVDEVLPGDHMRYRITAYCRLSTPLFPLFDSQRIDTHFFYVPSRLLWDNWVRFMGEQDKRKRKQHDRK